MNAFHVIGAMFAAWAVLVAVLGISREGFPGRAGVLVGAISVVLAAGAISGAIISGAIGATSGPVREGPEPEGEKPAEAEEAGGPGLALAADPSGQLRFDKDELQGKAGAVVITMRNASPIPHDVSLEGPGVDKRGKAVSGGGTSRVEADLRPGRYTFYCSVDGHREAGMEGTLTVR